MQFPGLRSTSLSEGIGENGNVEHIKWLRDRKYLIDDKVIESGCQYGHISVLDYYYNEYPLAAYRSHFTFIAAKYNRLEMLQWLVSKQSFSMTDCWVTASQFGHLDILKWYVQLYEFDPNYCRSIATTYKHQHIIDWIDAGMPN